MLRSKIFKMKYLIYLATNTTLNAQINKVKGAMPSITNLPNPTALNAEINEVKNKMLNSTTQLLLLLILLLKTKYLIIVIQSKQLTKTKINEIENKITTDHDHDKYITIQEFNQLE